MLDKVWGITELIVWATACYIVAAIIRRIFFHPLSSFPGPVTAAATGLYMSYYDVKGDWVYELESLHERYGNVVRIGPEQLHFSDPYAFDDIYAPGSKFTKDPQFYDGLQVPESLFGYTDAQGAKQRKDILRPLFSRRAILGLEGMIQTTVDKLVSTLLTPEYLEGKPANLHLGLLATTLEIITTYCFARPSQFIKAPDFRHHTAKALISTGSVFSVFQNFPILYTIAQTLPVWFAGIISPGYVSFKALLNDVASFVTEFKTKPLPEDVDHPIVFHHLSTGGEKGASVPSHGSLLDEASALMFAASDTVVGACVTGIFNILSNKDILEKLQEELQEAWEDPDTPMAFQNLEKLPYLTAVIKESLRTSHGVVSPLPRIVPTDTVIAGVPIPANTTVSIGSTFVHNNPEIFKEPRKFNPNRWLDGNATELERFLVPFSKGPRSCLGINLAWCELYMIISNIIRKTDLEIHGMTADDFKFKARITPKYRCSLYVLVNKRG